MTFFSGPVGVATKIALLSAANAIALWAEIVLIGRHRWIPVLVLALATLAIDAIYLTQHRAIPAKFLVPGTIFLLAFQVIPVVYTINVAFTNYSTGHILSKPQAIAGIKSNSLTEAENGKTYTMAASRDKAGHLVLVLLDEDTGKTYVGTSSGGGGGSTTTEEWTIDSYQLSAVSRQPSAKKLIVGVQGQGPCRGLGCPQLLLLFY